jgi:hypothetical protein
MDTYKHKTLAVVLAVAATYFGFQGLDLASGLYQMEIFFSLAWYLYAFHLVWLVFMFDLHFKRARNSHHSLMEMLNAPAVWVALKDRARHLYHWSYIRRYLNYLILPSVMYWSVVVLIYLNPFHELFKDGLIILTSASLAVVFWHLKEVFNHEVELRHMSLRLLSLIKLFAALLAFTATFAAGWYFGIHLAIMTLAASVAAVLLAYQSLFQHKLVSSRVWLPLIALGVVVACAYSMVFVNWNVNYYTAGLMVAVVYSCAWALLHHYLDRTLTRVILWEYVFTMIVLASIILATHDFQGRI